MTENTSTQDEKQQVPATGKNPMAEMCERMMSHWTSSCASKGFNPAACCAGTEPKSAAESVSPEEQVL